jgi:pyridoxine 5'-phosphate synthase PdxJ
MNVKRTHNLRINSSIEMMNSRIDVWSAIWNNRHSSVTTFMTPNGANIQTLIIMMIVICSLYVGIYFNRYYHILWYKNTLPETSLVYQRCTIKGSLYKSMMYRRDIKRNSYTISYRNSDGKRVFGEIKYFVAVKGKIVCIVKTFNVGHNFFVHRESTKKLEHIIPVTETNIVHAIYSDSVFFLSNSRWVICVLAAQPQGA